MEPNISRRIYLEIVIPVLNYGVLVWWHFVNYKSIADELNTVQRRALLCMPGAIETTPFQALEVFIDMLLIHLHFK